MTTFISKSGAFIFCVKNGGSIFWKNMGSYDTVNKVTRFHRGSPCSIIMSSSTACFECIQDVLNSYFRLLVVENVFMWRVTISMNMILVPHQWHFLHNADKWLSTTLPLHRSPLKTLFCDISLVKNFHHHKTPFSFSNMEPPIFTKSKAPFFQERSCHMILENICFVVIT